MTMTRLRILWHLAYMCWRYDQRVAQILDNAVACSSWKGDLFYIPDGELEVALREYREL